MRGRGSGRRFRTCSISSVLVTKRMAVADTITPHGPASPATIHKRVTSGETVRLSAKGTSDPDGDKFSLRWFQYREAGTYPSGVRIKGRRTHQASFVAPDVDSAKTIHVILEIEDDGLPSLFGYRRVVVAVATESRARQTEHGTPAALRR